MKVISNGLLLQVLQLIDVWSRFQVLTNQAQEAIPPSFTTRRSTFKEKLEMAVDDVYQFYQPLDREISERKFILIPQKFRDKATSDLIASDSDPILPSYKPGDGDNVSLLVHSALKVRSDLVAKPGYQGLDVTEDDVSSVIPNSLHLFLSVLFGGQSIFNSDVNENEDSDECCLTENEEEDDSELMNCLGNAKQMRVVSIAQDIIYGVSAGRKWTPKHIGLALTLHQKTRSRKLVSLFSKAGHCLSYKQLLTVDTAFAECTLGALDENTGAVTPSNFLEKNASVAQKQNADASNNTATTLPKKAEDIPEENTSEESDLNATKSILHITADNIDILSESLDGKGTFYATQMVAFMRGRFGTGAVLSSLRPSKAQTLQVPQSLNKIYPSKMMLGKKEPVFKGEVNQEWFAFREVEADCVQKARAADLVFVLRRQESTMRV